MITMKDDRKVKDMLKKYGYGKSGCAKHGLKYCNWKCMCCCSIAIFNCGGNNFYCGPCHGSGGERRNRKPICTGGKKCPLGVPYHP